MAQRAKQLKENLREAYKKLSVVSFLIEMMLDFALRYIIRVLCISAWGCR